MLNCIFFTSDDEIKAPMALNSLISAVRLVPDTPACLLARRLEALSGRNTSIRSNNAGSLRLS